MIVYAILIYIIAALFIHHSFKARRAGIQGLHTPAERGGNADVWIIGLACAALIALRSINVGIDTPHYEYIFTSTTASEFVMFNRGAYATELGYEVLQRIIAGFGLGFRAVLIVEAIIFILPVGYIIHKYSVNPYFSFLLFIAFDYYLFAMTGIRQSIALGLTVAAFDFAIRKKPLPFILLVALASTMHITALVFLPAYILILLPPKKITYIFAAAAFLAVYLVRGELWALGSKLARIQYDVIQTGGTRMLILYVLIVLSDFVLPRNTETPGKVHVALRHLMIAAIIAYPVLQFNPNAFRIHYYYTIFLALYIPSIVASLKWNWLKAAAGAGYLAVAGVYMYLYTLQNMGAVPYAFL